MQLSSGVSSSWQMASGPSTRSSGTRGNTTVPSGGAHTLTSLHETDASHSKNCGHVGAKSASNGELAEARTSAGSTCLGIDQRVHGAAKVLNVRRLEAELAQETQLPQRHECALARVRCRRDAAAVASSEQHVVQPPRGRRTAPPRRRRDSGGRRARTPSGRRVAPRPSTRTPW